MEAIRKICENNHRISAKVIDEFLIYFYASRNNLEKKMNQKFSAFKHITREFKQEWVNMLKAQYLAHNIFKKDGDINQILNYVEIQRLSRDEIDFLDQQASKAWRFSFSVITSNPAKDFFEMLDVFSGEQYTLFSTGTTNLLETQSTSLWFNLIAYNGSCWQTYGPIGAYRSFEPDDIYFFATELRPSILDDDGLLEDVERNPIPYMMLLSGANFPFTFNKDDQLVQVLSEYDLKEINSQELNKHFKSEYNDHVYRYSFKGWDEPPHFANAYYDEKEKRIILTALTDRGFQALVKAINRCGYSFSDEPFIRVNPTMIVTANKILKKVIVLNEYEDLFHKKPPKDEEDELKKINAFINLILPDVNAGREPNIKLFAEKSGINIETAHQLFRNIKDKFGKNTGS